MMNVIFSITFYFVVCPSVIVAQSAHRLYVQGDNHYLNEDYLSAEENYRKAKARDNSLQANFNLGNSVYHQERYEEATDHYLNAVSKAATKGEKSIAYYNLGNTYFKNQDLEEAMKAYKQAVRFDPSNDAAKYNLLVVKELLKQARQQQQQQQNQDEQSDDQQDKGEQDQQPQNEENQSEDQQQQSEDNEAQQDSSQQMQGGQFDSTRLEKQSLDSIDAAKLLEIIQSEELKVQEKLRKFNASRKKPDKDW